MVKAIALATCALASAGALAIEPHAAQTLKPGVPHDPKSLLIKRTITTPALQFTGWDPYTGPPKRTIATPALQFTGWDPYTGPPKRTIQTPPLQFTGK